MTDARSLWIATAPRIPVDADLPADTEVAIAGGGLAGIAAGLALAERGHRVVVLEAERLGARTTGGSTGKLTLLQGTTFSRILRHAGDEVLRAYRTGNAAGRDWMRAHLEGMPGALARRDAVTYATTEDGERALREEADALAAAGVEVEQLGPGGVGLPFEVAAGLRLPDQDQLHPLLALAVLTAKLRRLRGVVVEGCRVRAAEPDGAGLRVSTDRGDIRADRLVLATGSPILDRGRMSSRLSVSREFAAAYRLPDAVRPPKAMYLSVDPVPRSLRSARGLDGEPVLVVTGDPFETGREDDTAARLAALDAWVRAVYPRAWRITWWAAQDYRTTSSLPHAAEVPGSRGRILAATGFAKWGMTNAAAAALALAGQVAGDEPQWSARLREHRGGLRDAAQAVSLNAAVAGHLVGGWAAPHTRAEGPAATVQRRAGAMVAESIVRGKRCAVSAVCTHLGGIVRWNSAEQTWDCPLHGSRFAPDGRVIEGPAVDDLAPRDPSAPDERG
ncbi:FAD-dependent oxidoreductase [Microbacterium sp. Marseille-Q6965]|uniref:FAD-dependent oxidoreductase n=1 Tax=Microbacterium sp. Marseille-Q6965 TaxID=2965072 RepID=UPI0021B753D2|nr:FAD-dependent oxidoreductase [Microbacterium sp. Marseille-Q6965]